MSEPHVDSEPEWRDGWMDLYKLHFRGSLTQGLWEMKAGGYTTIKNE